MSKVNNKGTRTKLMAFIMELFANIVKVYYYTDNSIINISESSKYASDFF